MRLLIVSDTHGSERNLISAIGEAGRFDLLLHLGDVEGEQDVIEAMAGCPCYFVAGNNDFFSGLPEELILSVEGARLYMTHGHRRGMSRDMDLLVAAAKENGASAALFGHTHRPVLEERSGILLINPGSLTFPRQLPRRPSYIVADCRDGKLDARIRYL